MANTLTGLIPTLYTALDTVSRELIGFIPNVSVDAAASGAAVGQVVRAHVAPPAVAEDIVPGMQPANTGDQTITGVDVSITKARAVPVKWNGEEQLALGPNGTYNRVLADQFAQAFRTLSNEVESDLGALYALMARGYGTAGSTPFAVANDHTDFAQANRILDEMGAPASDRAMVIGSTARAQLEGKHPELFKVNEAGDAGQMLRNRIQRQLHGFTMGYSAGIKRHTPGAAAGRLVNNGAGYAPGATSIAFDTGSGAFVAGDLVSFDTGTEKYVARATGSTPLVINAPGLKDAVADNAPINVSPAYTANMFFHRSALLLAARAPAMPEGGDAADDVTTVHDPVSGLTFQVALYRLYRQVKFEIGLAWGVAAPNGKHGGILLG